MKRNLRIVFSIFILLFVVSFTKVEAKDIVINIDASASNITHTINGLTVDDPGSDSYMESKYTFNSGQLILPVNTVDKYYIYTNASIMINNANNADIQYVGGSGAVYMSGYIKNKLEMPYAILSDVIKVENVDMAGNYFSIQSVAGSSDAIIENSKFNLTGSMSLQPRTQIKNSTVKCNTFEGNYSLIENTTVTANQNIAVNIPENGKIKGSTITAPNGNINGYVTIDNSTITSNNLTLHFAGPITNSNLNVYAIYQTTFDSNSSTAGNNLDEYVDIKKSNINVSFKFSAEVNVYDSEINYNSADDALYLYNVKNSKLTGEKACFVKGNVVNSELIMMNDEYVLENKVRVYGELNLDHSKLRTQILNGSISNSKLVANNSSIIIGSNAGALYQSSYLHEVELNNCYFEAITGTTGGSEPIPFYTPLGGSDFSEYIAKDNNGVLLTIKNATSNDRNTFFYDDNTVATHIILYKPLDITFKVANGTWEDGTDDDITVSTYYYGDLNRALVPKNMKAKAGYKDGDWDKEIVYDELKDEVVYTYAFVSSGQNQSSANISTDTPTNPSTGENTLMYAIVLLGSTCGIIGVRKYKKRLG